MINIPAIPDNIREFTRSRFKELGNEKFYSELSKLDPQIIGKIHPNNSHRLMRAYEIKKSTNYSVYDLEYFAKTISVIDDYEITKIYLKPEREFLYKICEMRFDHMISNGAIEEVESIEQNYDQLSLSAKKIIGLTEIYEYLNNRLNLQDATLQAKQKTRNYAKRQYTWFNNQIGHDIVIDFASLSEYEILIKNVISRCTKSFYA
jgi:tRNA dimethylallyltransferase